MNTIILPDTNLQVTEICLGNPLGGDLDRAAAFGLLDAYVAEGGNFIDTAHVYNDWIPGGKSASEKTIGAWLKQRGRRSDLVIATKGAHPRLESMRTGRLSPTEILGDLEESLEYLEIETIDLYWLHRDDTNRPVAEILETLNGQVKAGKIRYFGASNWSAPRLAEAQTYARQQSLQPFSGDQMLWNAGVVDMTAIPDPTMQVMDDALLDFHRTTNLAVLAYTSQANGLFNRLQNGTYDQWPAGARQFYPEGPNRARLERILQLAQTCEKTVGQIVLGFLLSQPFPTVPIIGPRNISQLLDSLSAAGTRLSADQLTYLNQ